MTKSAGRPNGGWGILVLFMGGLVQAAAGGVGEYQQPVFFVSRVILLADKTEHHIAHVLKERIRERSKVRLDLSSPSRSPRDSKGALLIRLGTIDTELENRCREWGIAPPSTSSPGPEGFLLETRKTEFGVEMLAVGVDRLGTLYAVGEVLRSFTYRPHAVGVRILNRRTAPAYRWRGSSANQGGTMRQITGARTWTVEERRRVVLDHALAGANTFYAGSADIGWLKSFGFKVEAGCRPNQLPDPPPRWRRKGTDRGNYVCPSIPEARKALLAHWGERFKNMGDRDVLRFFAGDPGGCRCDRCMPWGRTFVLLCEELAALWYEYHPGTEVQICNQDLTNEGDLAIFEYLNEKPRTWLTSLSYGPGSNAMSPYFRKELREDLFRYPGDGPINRYLAYTLHSLPVRHSIVHYSDITHWIRSQYEVENPEPNLIRIYGRRTFHQRPQCMYWIFHRIMPFSEGDIIYSEGYHDELHQYLWNRMLWDPHKSLEDLLLEYAVYHFGEEAALEMAEASIQLEENLETPLLTNEGIDRYYQLVESAGKKIPDNLMERDHRWRLHMQKALLDRYFQIKLRRDRETVRRIDDILKKGLPSNSCENSLKDCLEVLDSVSPTKEMKELLERAERLGRETEDLFGVRNVGFFRREIDLVGLTWLRHQIVTILDATGDRELRIRRLIHYEDPGEDGFYDNAGVKGEQPHLVEGLIPWDPAQFAPMLDPKNRPSANLFAYSTDGPVVFEYDGLDTEAQYRVRVTLVGVRMPPEVLKQYGYEPGKIEVFEDILADDTPLAENLRIPIYTADLFEFEIPGKETRDGSLRLVFRGKDLGGTKFTASVVSEVWLMKSSE